MLNDLLGGPVNSIIDPAINQSFKEEIKVKAREQKGSGGGRGSRRARLNSAATHGVRSNSGRKRKARKLPETAAASTGGDSAILASRRREQALVARRQQALADIAEVGKMLEDKQRLEQQRKQLSNLLKQQVLTSDSGVSVHDFLISDDSSDSGIADSGRGRGAKSLEEYDLSLAPSSRSLEWWRRLGSQAQRQQEAFRK